ncbi:MAG TPA: discoidin domain-containing protein [Actinospica sp.]|jgi:hypothetical protein|nr:discoidin domain-containing protein [Actinospica sp.]
MVQERKTSQFVWESPEPAEQVAADAESGSRFALPPRRALYAGAAAIVLAAGTFGIVDYAAGHGSAKATAAGSTVSGTATVPAVPAAPAVPAVPVTSATTSISVSPSASPSPSRAAAPSATHSAAAAATTTPTDLALGKTESSSSHAGSFVASNVIDGNAGTYWQSQVDSGSFTEWVQVDLESATKVSKIVMRLPPSWSSRTQTIEIYGLATGYDAFVIEPTSTYSFDRASGNTVTVTFAALSTRYVQLVITGNSVLDAGQMGEVQIYR